MLWQQREKQNILELFISYIVLKSDFKSLFDVATRVTALVKLKQGEVSVACFS